MTPSSTHPPLARAAARSARRTKLLAASALCGVAAMLAQPALAQLPGVPSAANITVSTGGSQPIVTAPDANTLEIDLNAPRTVINWPSLNVGAADAMNFHFDANSDIVLNKTTSQITIASGGTVTGKVGASDGGNIWFYSPQGVIVSPGAVMTGGGFLFSRGAGMVDAAFVDAADPLANLRAATDALIRINTISTATSASIDASGDVLLSASSGALNVGIAAGATVELSTTSGSITASEVRATSGAASVTAGGPGATVSSITGATGVTVSSDSNTSVGSATTTTSGDIVLTSAGSVSLTLGNSARDTLLTAPLIFLSTLDTGRDAVLTGDTGVTVTNRIFAGDDIELTASNGNIAAGGAYLRSTGLGASDDAHILLRSDTGSVTATNTLQTLGTGTQAGDITVQAATTASAGTATATRDLKVTGVTASLASGSAARDVFVTATTGGATVTTAATAGDDLEVTATTGAVSASGATLRSTGVGATDDAHVLARSTGGTVDFGTAITEGAGVALGNVIIDAAGTTTGTAAQASRDVSVTAAGDITLASATAGRDITVSSTGGGATLGAAEMTGTGAGHDLLVSASGDAILGAPDYSSITTANVFSRTGGNTGTATVRSTTGDAKVYLDASAAIDTLEGLGVDVTISSGPASFGTVTASTGDLYVEALDGDLTVGTATATAGDLDLIALGGDLTITGSVQAAGLAHLEADGLLDGTSASLISADGGVQLYGGAVDVGTVSSLGTVDVAAASGDASVQVAQGDVVQVGATGDAYVGSVEAVTAAFVVAGGDALIDLVKVTDAAGFAIVHGDNDATVRAAEAPAGILVDAVNTATFGAADEASITAANYLVTDPGCGCGSGGLQVFSTNGDAAVFIDTASNGIGLVGASQTGNAIVVQNTGDLLIEELAGRNITVKAASGTLETGLTTIADGDYNITARDFLGDALTPTLFNGLVRDVTITDTLGGLNLGVLALHADRRLTVTALNGGAVTGSGLLDAGAGAHDGVVAVTAAAISLDAVLADQDVSLTATTGNVDLGTGGVHADRLLHITALSGALTSLGQLDAGQGAGAHDGEVNLAALGMTLAGVSSDGDVALNSGTGGIALGSVVHADRILSITALNGAVTGAGQLDAGSGTTAGDIDVTADAIDLDTIQANRDVDLDAGTGLVNVSTSVSVARTYRLTGGDFSAAVLAPLGAKAGTWTIIDQAGDFDFSGETLHYGSSVAVNVLDGDVIGGAITSDAGTVFVEAEGGSLGALSAGGGQVTAIGNVGGMAVGSAQGVARITVTAENGSASLGSAILTGPGIHGLTVRATNGDVVLGAASPGAITTGNVVTSTGSSLALVAEALAGTVDVNLDHTTNASMTTLDGRDGVTVRVVNGAQRIVTARSIAGSVWITGPTGALSVDQLTAADVSQVRAGGETRLVSANVTGGGLSVVSTGAGVRLGDATPGRVIASSGLVSLNAATDITQQGAIHASGLGGSAGTGVVLLGDNQVAQLGAFGVSGGGLAFHNTTDFEVVSVINAAGQTVDLRSDQTIGQTAVGVITAQTLTGSSVGGAVFDAANQVAELGDFTNTGGLLKLNNNRALTVSGTVLSTGAMSLAAHGGMTIAGTGAARADGAGDAVVLASDGVFTNARGADAVTAADPGGRWLIYTQAFGDPQGSTAGNTFNGLSGKSFYGSAYDFAASGFAVAPNAGNRFVYADQPTITVTPDSQVVTYDGAIPSLSATVTGLVNGDLFTDAWTGALVISGATSKNVGTYGLNAVTGGLTSDLNYAFAAGAPGSLRIDPKALTGVLIANDKTYDGGAAATGVIGLTGVVTGDAVSAAGTYAFADQNAGTGKTVTVSGVVLSGADVGNYTLASTAGGEADIFQRDLTGALIASNKTYDGTTTAAGSISLTGVLAGDTVTASGAYAFHDRDAGLGKTVTASGAVLAGLDAGNYSLTGVSDALADILRRSVTVAADNGFKPFGQVEPTLTYRIMVGDLATGDAFTGVLARAAGETPGDYAITRGTLALSANYDLTFTGAVFTIRPIPSNEQGGASALKQLNQSPDFTLDWDPEPDLTTEGQAAQGAPSAGGLTVAALR